MKSYPSRSRTLPALLCIAFLGLSSPVAADEARELARKNGCFNCHTLETDSVGPAWITVADKYRGDPGAEVRLVTKVSKGGKGVWGMLPMPSFAAQIKEADIRTLVKYILSLK